MTKRPLIYILGFATSGLLLAVWDIEFNFAPVPWDGARELLQLACFDWLATPPFRWIGHSLVFEGPMNASIYGVLGYVVGRALR